jgi:hypothetical protein
MPNRRERFYRRSAFMSPQGHLTSIVAVGCVGQWVADPTHIPCLRRRGLFVPNYGAALLAVNGPVGRAPQQGPPVEPDVGKHFHSEPCLCD